MLITEFYNGQGLGNQLWAYCTLRSIAKFKKCDYGLIGFNRFKANCFLNIDPGQEFANHFTFQGGPPLTMPPSIKFYYKEKFIFAKQDEKLIDVSYYDPFLFAVPDNTKIDGNLQSFKYIEPYIDYLYDWLNPRLSETFISRQKNIHNCCILNIRGGEYTHHSHLILKRQYWINAMENMKAIFPHVNFAIVTDDYNYCNSILPEIDILKGDISHDFLTILTCKYCIASNSSFSYLALLANKNKPFVIAPKYWACHNRSSGLWATRGIMNPIWHWQDLDGTISKISLDSENLFTDNITGCLRSSKLKHRFMEAWLRISGKLLY